MTGDEGGLAAGLESRFARAREELTSRVSDNLGTLEGERTEAGRSTSLMSDSLSSSESESLSR